MISCLVDGNTAIPKFACFALFFGQQQPDLTILSALSVSNQETTADRSCLHGDSGDLGRELDASTATQHRAAWRPPLLEGDDDHVLRGLVVWGVLVVCHRRTPEVGW